jgi:hypothetical protein
MTILFHRPDFALVLLRELIVPLDKSEFGFKEEPLSGMSSFCPILMRSGLEMLFTSISVDCLTPNLDAMDPRLSPLRIS